MGSQNRAHTRGITGTLELDCTIDAVRIGAGERTEPPLRRGLGKHLRTRGTETEGKMSVGVEVGEHF
jgi:hypothetical protein